VSFPPQHELHRRRFGRNVGLSLVLVGFVALVFALTVVKVTRGDPMRAFDHTVRPEMVPADAPSTPTTEVKP
jgi:hypothetical protein